MGFLYRSFSRLVVGATRILLVQPFPCILLLPTSWQVELEAGFFPQFSPRRGFVAGFIFSDVYVKGFLSSVAGGRFGLSGFRSFVNTSFRVCCNALVS